MHSASHIPNQINHYSRYCRASLIYPDPLADENGFLSWCMALLAQNQYKLIIPVTERTVAPLARLQDKHGVGHLTLPGSQALEIVLDKARTLALAETLAIPTPRSVVISDMLALEEMRTEYPFPVVLKPTHSIGKHAGIRKQLRVEYAFNANELTRKIEHFLRYGPVLLQSYFRGQGVGIELIARHGEILFAFQHLRLHEVPLTGGGSSLRKSVAIEPELLEASRKLVSALKWHGVAMVEFKWNPMDRSYCLMEINGRFWGSLPLAIAAGADFPAMLHELYSTGGIKPRPPARVGVYCRMLSRDLYWHEMVLRRDGRPELVHFPGLGQMLREALLVFSPRHHFDVQQWRDPVPGLVDLGRIVLGYRARLARLLSDRWLRWRQRRAWLGGEVAGRLAQARQILFVCHGNINRSALADRCFAGLVPEGGVRAYSAGFHEEAGRPADPIMVEVAGSARIDLVDWRSRHLDMALLDESDIVFVMETKHLERIREEYPDAVHKTFLLNAGPMIGGSLEIADPYGKDRPVYEQVCRQVTGCVAQVARLLG